MADRSSEFVEVEHPSAPEGKALKYARPERERRFLLESRPAGDVLRTVEITDRYFRGTRIRLREAIDRTANVTRSLYKLTQKIPAPDGGPGLITTFYLDANEYSAMSTVAADVLRKTRLSIPPLGVDTFHGPLNGLVLAEAEFESDESMRTFRVPVTTVAEVTHDERFTGGRLATINRDQLRSDLELFGISAPSLPLERSGPLPAAKESCDSLVASACIPGVTWL